MDQLKAAIREIPDWPKKGILFYDVTTLLKDGARFREAMDALITPYQDKKVDMVIGVEARGFIFAPTVAYALGAGFVPVRKPGKLPSATYRASYELSTARTASKFIRTPSSPASAFLSWTTSSPPAAPRRPWPS